MSNALKGFAAAISIFSFFCLMSRMDYIVHGILYRYGLQFSYNWANEYWAIYTSLFVFCSIAMALMYWLGSNKTSKDLKISIGLLATINILMIGGLQDLLFYTLWGNGLPPDNIIWWWTPLSHYFGTWNSSMQVALTVLTCSATVPLWLYILKNKGKGVRLN
jgi:hypothetical protein